MKKTLIAFALVAGTLMSAWAKDVVDTPWAQALFKTLVAAAQAAGPWTRQGPPGPLTIFAPAMRRLPRFPRLQPDALAGRQGRRWTKVLTYHVVPAQGVMLPM